MEVIRGLSVLSGQSSPQKIYLEVDSNKICYVILPNGQVLTSIAGIVNYNWTGAAGRVKLLVPKDTITRNIFGDLIFGSYGILQYRNLFDKENVTNGKYVSYVNGALYELPDYQVSDFIAVEPNTQYTRTSSGDTEQMAFYSAANDGAFISGLAEPTSFTTPPNCNFVRLSIKVSTGQPDTLMLATGNNSIYIPYSNNIVTVAEDGANCKDVLSAIALCTESEENPCTIIIYDGTYYGHHDIAGKHIHLYGISLDDVIIREDSGNYYTNPINISGGGCKVSNLTVKATHDDVENWVQGAILGAYAIHCDAIGEGTSIIDHCVLWSYQHAAVGIGLHNNQTLLINNCELKNLTVNQDEVQGALYAHNQQSNGAVNQKLFVNGSNIYSLESAAVRCEDANHRPGGGAGDLMDTEFTFANNTCTSGELGTTGIVVGDEQLGDGTWGHIKLVNSFGNNVSELNN